MKGAKQSRRDAKQLFKSCQVDGQLIDDRVRQAVALLTEKKPRGYFGILQELQRLVKLDVNSRMARVESAITLSESQKQNVQTSLGRLAWWVNLGRLALDRSYPRRVLSGYPCPTNCFSSQNS